MARLSLATNPVGVPPLSELRGGAIGVTQRAAIAASQFFGRRDPKAANAAAAEAMCRGLAELPVDGTIALGEGVQGVVPVLHNGQRLGSGGPEVAIGVDAVEGATSTALGHNNAISILVLSHGGGLLSLPDLYMDKIAVGPGLPDGVIDLDAEPADNVRRVAEAKGMDPSDLVVCLLDRPRHDSIFAEVIAAGARTMAIPDGDIGGIMAVALPDSGVDMYMGSGGAPEGVFAAAALHCLGGQMCSRLRIRNTEEEAIAQAWGVADSARIYSVSDLAWGDIVVAATGVTNGILLDGVRRSRGASLTHSLIVDSDSGKVEFAKAMHDADAS